MDGILRGMAAVARAVADLWDGSGGAFTLMVAPGLGQLV